MAEHAQFSEREREWIEAQPSRKLSSLSTTVARTLAAEALAGSPREHSRLSGIEVIRDEAGAPFVVLTGDAAALAQKRGIVEVGVSLSEDSSLVAGVAIALSEAGGSQPDRRRPATALSVGVDLVSFARTADLVDYPIGALARIFSEQELVIAWSEGPTMVSGKLATMFAVKEATFKALAAPLRQCGARCPRTPRDSTSPADVRDVAVCSLQESSAGVEFRGTTAETVRRLGLCTVRVGITADQDMVAAVALATSKDR